MLSSDGERSPNYPPPREAVPRFAPLKIASSQGLHRKTDELLETSQNHGAFLLEEDVLILSLP